MDVMCGILNKTFAMKCMAIIIGMRFLKDTKKSENEVRGAKYDGTSTCIEQGKVFNLHKIAIQYHPR
jgi:hypothetical protein